MTNIAATRVLLVEDSLPDALFVKGMLGASTIASFDPTHVESLGAAVELVRSNSFDVILLDLNLPDSKGLSTFMELHSQCRRTPIVIMSSNSDEECAMSALAFGAQDYLVKGVTDSSTLIRCLRYSMERSRLLIELEDAMERIKTLKGLIPICAKCKKIRDGEGYWHQVESYMSKHTGADFTHGYCEACTADILKDIP